MVGIFIDGRKDRDPYPVDRAEGFEDDAGYWSQDVAPAIQQGSCYKMSNLAPKRNFQLDKKNRHCLRRKVLPCDALCAYTVC